MLKHHKLPSELGNDLVEFISSGNNFKLLLVSGGSLLPKLDEDFKELAKAGHDLTKVTITVLDERYAENPSHKDSNFSQLISLESVSKLKSLGVRFRPILESGRDIHTSRSHFNAFLETAFSDPNYDTLGILGLGADYHIAGILPHNIHHGYMFYETNAIAYSLDEVSLSNNEHKERITISFTGITRLDQVWMYAVGEDKKDVISGFWEMLDSPDIRAVNETPAQALAVLPELTLYTDQLD